MAKSRPAAKTAVSIPPKNTQVATQGKGRGFEEETQREDLIIPRAKLLQALSPEVAEGDMKSGMIINSLTKEPLPQLFIPIFKFTNWIRFNPRESSKPGYDAKFGPGDIIWRSSDPYDKRVIEEGKFGDDGERPLATKFLNFFSLFPGVSMPIIVSFSNSSFKTGKELISLAQFANCDMFGRLYELKSVQTKNDLGTFYVLKVAPKGAPEEADFKVAEKLWDDFHSKDIKVDEAKVDDVDQDNEARTY